MVDTAFDSVRPFLRACTNAEDVQVKIEKKSLLLVLFYHKCSPHKILYYWGNIHKKNRTKNKCTY